jgi:hypothetical protein
MKCKDCINCIPGIGSVFCVSDTYDPNLWTINMGYTKDGAEKCVGFIEKENKKESDE